jgi:N-acetylneuraminic acid mutarotase
MIKMIINNLIKILLLIILLIEIVQSLTPADRSVLSSVLVDKKIFFFGGYSINSPNVSPNLNQILYLDVSKPLNTANPPFEEIPNAQIPFGSSFATAFFSPQKNTVYLFGGIMVDVNTDLDSFKSVLYSYNLETNEWAIPITNGIEPKRKREISSVINNGTGKSYIFGGINDKVIGSPNLVVFNDMNIFNTISSTWSKGSVINAPLPRMDYTATLLSNGIIVFIGGRELYLNNIRDVDINQVNKLNIAYFKFKD